MKSEELLERIVIDPNLSFGRPTIQATRIWVGLVLDLLADGMSLDEILHEYPSLTHDDIRACLAFRAKMSSGRFVDVASGIR